MTTDEKFTPWFHGKIKPVRVGVYERKFIDTPGFSYWDGKNWFIRALCENDAAYYGRKWYLISENQSRPWRGLNADPKKAAEK
jgi:hypothetical protein